jgi:hypothetical protein
VPDRWLRACTLVFFATLSWSQTINVAVEDSRLKTAKTIAIFIDKGPELPSPYPPDLDRAKKQVMKKISGWKRLQLVAEPAQADIVMVITEFNQNAGVIAHSYGSRAVAHDKNCLADEVKIYPGGKKPASDDIAIWSRSESCGWSWPLNRALDAFWKTAK